MSNLRPSPGSNPAAPSGRERRVSWGNRRVREYLLNDPIAEDGERSEDIDEGPVVSSASSQTSPMLQIQPETATPEREQPRNVIMVTPIRQSKSPLIRSRSSRLDRRKLTPMKSYGFSLSKVLKEDIPVTPIKPQTAGVRTTLEAQTQSEQLQTQISTLSQEKHNLKSAISAITQQIDQVRKLLSARSEELQKQDTRSLQVTRQVLGHLLSAVDWVFGYANEKEQVWHHTVNFYNAQFYSLFHFKIHNNSQNSEIYVTGKWPNEEVNEEFLALFNRKKLQFGALFGGLNVSEALERAAEEVDSLVLFMKELWKVKTALLVQECKFTDTEMVMEVEKDGKIMQIRTEVGSLRSWSQDRSGSLTSLLINS